ncbi:hypothetical protein SAMN05660236_2491 [Ohtaekwangia koreensis]|uniref:Uncharacterized protein n=2 Tax=Ohtaekwangia koreensis TaxID=688867 RepID=A0A1T5KQL7_9BACT|nr:hypothetical protein SAMN05660236_2491 [Ohtaekwangia koreensis]
MANIEDLRNAEFEKQGNTPKPDVLQLYLLKHAIQNTVYLQSILKKQFELQHLIQHGKIDKETIHEDLAEKLGQLDAIIQKEMIQALADISPRADR